MHLTRGGGGESGLCQVSYQFGNLVVYKHHQNILWHINYTISKKSSGNIRTTELTMGSIRLIPAVGGLCLIKQWWWSEDVATCLDLQSQAFFFYISISLREQTCFNRFFHLVFLRLVETIDCQWNTRKCQGINFKGSRSAVPMKLPRLCQFFLQLIKTEFNTTHHVSLQDSHANRLFSIITGLLLFVATWTPGGR